MLALVCAAGPGRGRSTAPEPPPVPLASHPAEHFFASGRAPALPLDLAALASASLPADVVVPTSANGWFQVTVVAVLPDEGAAAKRQGELSALLEASARHYAEPGHEEASARLRDGKSAAPVTPPEASAFAARGLTSAVGIGWPGETDRAREAVQRLGRILALPSLKGDFAGLKRHPLAALLEADGARVLLEGDPAGGASPLVDLEVEAPDEATARRLAESLDVYLAAAPHLFLRPPWHPAGVSPEQGRARATLVAVDRAQRAALVDPAFGRALARRIRRIREPAEWRRIQSELLRELASRAIDDVARRPDADAAVLDELRRELAASPGTLVLQATPALRARLAERLGCLALDAAAADAHGVEPSLADRAFGAAGRVEVDGRRVGLGAVAFQRFARGLPALLRWLGAAGCREARVEVGRDDANASTFPAFSPGLFEGD